MSHRITNPKLKTKTYQLKGIDQEVKFPPQLKDELKAYSFDALFKII